MSSPPVVTAAQLVQLTTSVKTILTGSDLTTILSQLPTAVVTLYQDIVAIYNATAAAQQALLIQVLQDVVGLIPGLPATDLQLLNLVISKFIPVLISYIPKIEAGVISGFIEAEQEITTCMSWCKSKCC